MSLGTWCRYARTITEKSTMGSFRYLHQRSPNCPLTCGLTHGCGVRSRGTPKPCIEFIIAGATTEGLRGDRAGDEVVDGIDQHAPARLEHDVLGVDGGEALHDERHAPLVRVPAVSLARDVGVGRRQRAHVH